MSQSLRGKKLVMPFVLGSGVLLRVPLMLLSGILMLLVISQSLKADADDPTPPQKPVKLVFVHHSCGENWLADNHGNLGRELAENHYFVSDTNYGWGPNSIGDRTDIPDWPEWFLKADSEIYLKALYETNDISSPYTRDMTDPGGENEIIMFKSCFPNSNLNGNPTDPPARGEGLTLSNAKWIYNQLLDYFASRPDKLFIAVTAPPVQDATYSTNARAFNNWLVRDWLKRYDGNNVAVFDFYNVLTGPRNHHRFYDGDVEHSAQPGRNTLYYPTNGDDHPSPAGNRKATEEFVPLLNVYYHRWMREAPVVLPHTAETRPSPLPAKDEKRPVRKPTASEKPASTETPSAPLVTPGGVIEDFESEANKWAVFLDEGEDTRLIHVRDLEVRRDGSAGLRIEYDIAAESWATCSLVYPSCRDWSRQLGLSVHLRGEQVGQPVIIVAYQGDSPENLFHFEFKTQIDQEGVGGWQRVDIPWEQLVQPPWQGDKAVPFDPTRAMGVAFAFQGIPSRRNAGKLWVDDLTFLSAQRR